MWKGACDEATYPHRPEHDDASGHDPARQPVADLTADVGHPRRVLLRVARHGLDVGEPGDQPRATEAVAVRHRAFLLHPGPPLVRAVAQLGREDVVLPGDLALRKAVQAAYQLGHLPAQQEVLAIAEKWRPYRSLATSYLFSAAFEPAEAAPVARQTNS